MRTRPLRSALVLVAAIAAVALGTTPSLSAAVTPDSGSGQDSSAASFDLSSPSGSPAVARMDPRDSTVERALKHRDPLVAVSLALVGLAALAWRPSRLALACVRHTTTAPSPFFGRAPPAFPTLFA